MRQKVFVWLLFLVLAPGLLSAQERKLKGKVVRVSAQGEESPEVGLTVTLEQSGDTDNTNSHGVFGIFLPDLFKAGEKVTLSIDKAGWRIQYPLDGEVRIPAVLEKELVEVRLLPKGSKLFWTADRIEKFIAEMAEEAKQQVSPEGKPQDIDFSRYIKDWAVRYGFSVKQAKAEIDKWVAEVEEAQDDLYQLGLAAFAKRNFGEAGRLFGESAENGVKRLREVIAQEEALQDKKEVLVEEVIRDFRLKGDAYYNDYRFAEALDAYKEALGYVDRAQQPQLWAAVLVDVGSTNQELGSRGEGEAIQNYLDASVNAYRQALEVYTRAELPQDWAMTQNNLGSALQEQGTRTGGTEGAGLLGQAVAAFQLALLVRTREHLPPQWARTEDNLAETYWALEDWPNAAESYAGLFEAYPDYQTAYQRVSVLYHEVLFKFPEAFALDQAWLKQHPDDLSASVEFTEKHFTTGRFEECEQRIARLLANSEIELRVKGALQAIEIANLLALGKVQSVSARLEKLREAIATQPEDFRLGWSFDGTTHFIGQSAVLAAYRSWLLQLFAALDGENRAAILAGLQAVQGGFQVVDETAHFACCR